LALLESSVIRHFEPSVELPEVEVPVGPLVVRQGPYAGLVIALVGVLFMVLPWMLQWPWMGTAFFTCLGGVAAGVGWLAMRHRFVLALDQHGLHTPQMCVPWKSVVGVRMSRFDSFSDGPGQLILVGLPSPDALPWPQEYVAQVRRDGERLLGPIPWPGVLILDENAWNRHPLTVAAVMRQCLQRPEFRARLGVFPARM
jgi:hypothetical protein